MGVNQFTDLTSEEFQMMSCSSPLEDVRAQYIYIPPANLKLPKSVDWRKKKAVSGIRHTGQCASCYAFAAVAAIESHQFLKTGKMIELSEQNLLDCSSNPPYTNKGCYSGTVDESLRYVKENGINTRSSYGYEGKRGKCRFRKDHNGANVAASVMVYRNDEYALQAAVATIGPVTVTFNGQHMQGYISGIAQKPCTKNTTYHSLLVVGYGTDKGVDYWLLKNAWGKWGESGYMRVARNKNNYCGIARWPVFPVI
uniref:Peptidase C1A papain C-terminal domain-containing protein n=1 Tax=Drosophila mojavensis TaxID=7230 RepID=A0A0B4UCP9_DROMO|nr:hypothetical protein [Drosophila mojavensis]